MLLEYADAISFDEFVCLYQLILLQFQEIFIIENPLYWNDGTFAVEQATWDLMRR